ncbi:MAG: type II and III secretion system protein family protein [Sphingomonadales bacterium]|nr:type II and III secretion system protein family protein [Sphingomonadales bacterium]
MKSRLIHTLLTAACAVAPLALVPATAAHAQSVSRPTSDVALSMGRGQLITLPGAMTDVFVADDKIADVQVKSQRQLYVFGKAGGETTVYASNSHGDVIWSANVRVGSNIDNVDQMLRVAMPDARVTVSTMGANNFLLTGTVGAPEDAAEAQRLVTAFVGKDANVISRLKMATPLQVNLQVKFAEVSRSLVKTLGTNLTSIDSTGGFRFGIGQGRAMGGFNVSQAPLPPSALGIGNSLNTQYTMANGTTVTIPGTSVSPANGLTTLAGAGRFLGLDLLGALDAGETAGLVTTLAQPNLTTLSGETADFLAGGEYPIPISAGLGATSIEYKKYGVSLSYTPTVLANGRISLRVRPEVSELSSEGSVTLNGFVVPALTIRRTETTIELGSGQSFMIAGLMTSNAQNTITKLPGAGDMPIIGTLFRSNSFRKGETELVIVVTPYLVNPVNANDIKLPTDGYKTPDDMERVLGNMLNDGQSGGDRPKPHAAPGAAPNPAVGGVDQPAAPAPAPRTGAADGASRKTASAADAAPGFNLN